MTDGLHAEGSDGGSPRSDTGNRPAGSLTIFWLLLALAVTPYLARLGASSIWDQNEAFYVETPRQMVLSGDYVNPSFNGQPRFNKPVLSYWIVAGFYKAFGVSVTAERVPIALGALGIVLSAFVIGRVAFSMRTGVFAALIVATSPDVMILARRIFIDVYLALFMALTLMFFVLAETRPRRRRLYLLLMYVAVGLGVLTKGPVAVAIPALVCVLHLARARRLGEWRSLMLPWGALIVVAIVAPWYAAVYAQHGWRYIKEFFIDENVGRYTETVGLQDRKWWFYGPVLFSHLFPWTLVLPAAMVEMFRSRPRADAPVERRIGGLLLTWIAVFVVVFSFSRSKQDLYIFPVVPALAVLMAVLLDRACSYAPRAAGAARGSLVVAAVLLAMLGAALLWAFGLIGNDSRLAGATSMAITLLVGALAVVVAAVKRWPARAVTSLAATLVVFNWICVLVALPSIEQYKPVVSMTDVIKRHASDHAVVAHYKTILPSMVYYLGKPIVPVLDMTSLVRLAQSTNELYLLIRPGEYADFQPRITVPTCVLAHAPVLEAKLDAILARDPWPQVLLVGVGAACQ